MSVDYQNYFSTCPEFNLPCSNTCASHKHCKLCVKSFDNDYKCRRHFKEAHLSRAVVMNDQSCYPCKLTHGEPGCGRAHYHCPLCEKKVINRNRFIKHYEGHSNSKTNNVNTTSSVPSIPERERSEDEFGTSAKKEQVDEPKPKRQKAERKECPVCRKVMDVRSLPRHQREIHKEIYPTNVCVDEKRGLYMVRKSSHGGVAYPLHVQKGIWSPKDTDTKRSPFCENDSCRVYMEVAWRSGMNAVECQHIREVGVNTVYKEKVELQENDLHDLSPDGRFKMLKEERIRHCLSLAQAASADGAELLVNFEDGDRYIHFSIYDGGIHYYSKLGRVIVTCDLKNGYLDCGCCRRKRGCVHKAICLWYLHGIDKLEQFRGSYEEEDDELQLPSHGRPSGIDETFESTRLFYPPTDHTIVANMCKYLKEHKKIPLLANRDKSKAIPLKFTPSEKECPFCNVRLSKPIRITSKATVVTMDSVLQNAETYFAKCESCSMCFRYQEHNEGVHNFNDTFLLGLDVCIYLRECLQCHIPIGSATKVLEQTLSTKLNNQTVLNAFLHYDALCCHKYSFNCSICGYHPSIIIMDLNRKVAFQCNAESLRLPEDYDQNDEENDVVDCDKFWANVELSMIVRGFPGAKVEEFVVRPDLLSWAPFIGSKTRTGNFIYNTEHRKVKTEDGKIEEDCREVTEERLLEILQQSTTKDIQSFARKLGLTGKGSKLDVIMNIKNAVQTNDENFKKAFNKLWGCSGGWASGTCPHGIVYALKFLVRSESPRDYVDILLSMKHQPNITIVDVANLVAIHGNNRKKEMFHPHNGMLVEPTSENVAKGKSGELDISLEWLDDVQNVIDQGRTGHPITGSNEHYSLFDRFHESNCQKEREVLRRITHVRQLNGLLNTQRQEQLYNVFNKDNRFLNSMTPVNHIFLFRSNIDVLNERINEKQIKNIERLSSFSVTEDQFGRVTLDKTKRSAVPLHHSTADPPKAPEYEPSNIAPAESGNGCCVIESPSPSMGQNSPQLIDQSPSFNIHEKETEPNSLEPETSETFIPAAQPFNETKIEEIPSPELIDIPISPDSELENVFYSRPPSSPNASCDTTKRKYLESDDESFWIKDLGLHTTEKLILENGDWINDRIILAVFKILRLQECTAELAGLQDVIPAVMHGYQNKENRKRFVQIVNVRGNHWITLSNIKSCADQVCVYDSLVSLNRKGNEISYPISVEQCVCQLTRPVGFVNMVVPNVQQQRGGAACGLYSIANTVALCAGRDPVVLRWNQKNLAPSVMHFFVDHDVSSFLAATCKQKEPPIQKLLFQWVCWVHCHCAMPDDGKLMSKCKKCKRWFHSSCEDGNFDDPDWKCRKCFKWAEEARQWRKAQQEKREKRLSQFRGAAVKHSGHESLVKLYNKLNKAVFNSELPAGEDSVGFLNVKQYKECSGEKVSELARLGTTYSQGDFIFIVIFRETNEDELTVFTTLIHEMVHALQMKRKIRGKPHGKEYKILGKEVCKILKDKLHEFEKPYCDLVVDEKDILKSSG